MSLFPTSTSLVQSFAGALYGIQLGTTTMAAVNRDIDNLGLNTTLNSYFSFSFGNLTDNQVATNMVTNLGITDGKDNAIAFVTGVLAAAPAGTKGQAISGILAAFSSMTSDATYGTAATAWNQQVQSATNITGAANIAINTPGNSVNGLELTQRADILSGDAGDNIFTAPVTQNTTGSGQLANTFETGDVLNGGAGTDILRADLIGTGTIQDGNFFTPGTPISATTSGIEQVFLRAQRQNGDNTIDAEKMAGVVQWWTENSRDDIIIEDIRSETSATTFGMRLTDPGVNFNNFFNVLFMEGDTSATTALTLNLYEGPEGVPNTTTQLANITVREITFTVAGEKITLDTPAIRAANTWVELETALRAALTDLPGAEGISLVNRGNGQFVFEDTNSRDFQVTNGEALVLSITNNITVTNALTVGRDEVTGPIVSHAVLDGAGNGSQGGALNIGAMSGLQGIEVLNLSTDRDSHVQSVTSFNQTPGQYGTLRNGAPNEFLEVVNLSSIGARGDLTVGRTNPNAIDGRVQLWSVTGGVVDAGPVLVPGNSGFVNVREVNGATFAGDLNLAVTLDNNSIGRYLDPATGEIEFNYRASAGNDIFNIADLSTLGGVSRDQDFAMNVAMGAGNDRLIINVPTVSDVTVDGGTGANSIVVAQSHGTNAATTFETFANFQTYEVEGTGAGVTNDTAHNFARMPGITNVIVATDDNLGAGAGDDTQLINLAAAQNVTISGKNQTAGNDSTADQDFDQIRLTDDAGATRIVTLDNTARLSNTNAAGRIDGRMFVNQILVDATPTGTSATRTLEVNSSGERNTANLVNAVDATRVTTLNLTGSQDLSLNVNALAALPVVAAITPAMTVTGANLTGNLTLAMNAAVMDRGVLDVVRGTAGTADTLQVYGANPGAATVSGFETIQLGGAFQNAATTFAGTYNASNTSGATLYSLQNLAGATTVSGLAGVVNAVVNSPLANFNVNFEAGVASAGNTLNLTLRDDAYNSTLTVSQFGAVNVNLTGDIGGIFNDRFDFNFNEGVHTRALAFAGGGDQGALGLAGGVDVLDLNGVTATDTALQNGLVTIDFSGFTGRVEGVVLDPATVAAQRSNTTVLVNGYDFDVTDTVTAQITTFRFTRDAVATSEDWTINGFRAFNDVGNVVGLTNLSVMDFSALGVRGLADISISQVGADVQITSNQGLNFEITLTGITTAELSNENMSFAQ